MKNKIICVDNTIRLPDKDTQSTPLDTKEYSALMHGIESGDDNLVRSSLEAMSANEEFKGSSDLRIEAMTGNGYVTAGWVSNGADKLYFYNDGETA